MSRRISQPYVSPALESLARQLLFAPPGQRRDQVARAEALHDQVDPAQDYPYEFIAYRITGHRVGEKLNQPLKGSQILPDLRLLIDTLSRSIDLAPEPGEALETGTQLANRLNVSEKTLSRWRRQGLRWRWVAEVPGGPRRLVYPAQAVERFLRSNANKVDRASRFTRMTSEETDALLARARRLAEAGDTTLNRVADHLARRTGRAVETVRRVLARHDREHPENLIFIDRTAPLSVKQRRVIARAHSMGVSVSKMARRFKRTRATIYRAINDRRAAALRQRRIEFVASPTFAREDAHEVILASGTAPAPGATPVTAPASQQRLAAESHHRAEHEHDHEPRLDLAGLPESLRTLFLHPPLDHDLQRSLLVRFNYLKFCADRQRAQLDRLVPRATELDQIESMLARADRIADRIILASLPTVLSLALRHLTGQAERSPARLLELLEISQEVLPRAVESFDAARGQTFEAHLTWLLLRRFAAVQPERSRALRRTEPDAKKALQHFRAAAKNARPDQDPRSL